jgi:hypothetical protein
MQLDFCCGLVCGVLLCAVCRDADVLLCCTVAACRRLQAWLLPQRVLGSKWSTAGLYPCW